MKKLLIIVSTEKDLEVIKKSDDAFRLNPDGYDEIVNVNYDPYIENCDLMFSRINEINNDKAYDDYELVMAVVYENRITEYIVIRQSQGYEEINFDSGMTIKFNRE